MPPIRECALLNFDKAELETAVRAMLAVAAVLAMAIPSFATADETSDQAAIKALGVAWQTAWNTRDAQGLGEILAPDASFISVLGPDTPGLGRGGRAEFQAAHAAILKSPMFAESKWTTTRVDVLRFLGNDVAVAQVLWETTGDRVRHIKHGAPRRGIFLWVLQRQSGQWRVVASQNTEAVPPLPGQ